MDKFKKENEELKEKLEKMEEQLHKLMFCQSKGAEMYGNQNKLLREKIEKLKEQVEFHKEHHDYYYCKYEELGTMIEDAKDKQAIINKLKEEIVEYESVEQSLMKCVREGGGYDEMLPIHYRQESESDDE